MNEHSTIDFLSFFYIQYVFRGDRVFPVDFISMSYISLDDLTGLFWLPFSSRFRFRTFKGFVASLFRFKVNLLSKFFPLLSLELCLLLSPRTLSQLLLPFLLDDFENSSRLGRPLIFSFCHFCP